MCKHCAHALNAVLKERRTTAVDVMNEYFDEIGGRPEPKAGQKRKGRASGVKTESETGTPVASAKRPKQIKQETEWAPPPGSWEHEVEYIDTVEETRDLKTGMPTRYVYVVWNKGQKTQHPLKIINQKCPQKVRTFT
jgi:chromobox protein 1